MIHFCAMWRRQMNLCSALFGIGPGSGLNPKITDEMVEAALMVIHDAAVILGAEIEPEATDPEPWREIRIVIRAALQAAAEAYLND